MDRGGLLEVKPNFRVSVSEREEKLLVGSGFISLASRHIAAHGVVGDLHNNHEGNAFLENAIGLLQVWYNSSLLLYRFPVGISIDFH